MTATKQSLDNSLDNIGNEEKSPDNRDQPSLEDYQKWYLPGNLNHFKQASVIQQKLIKRLT